MQRFAAHYIYDGEKPIRMGVIELDDNDIVVKNYQLVDNQEIHSCSFHDGIIKPCKTKQSIIGLSLKELSFE
jgi:hypothetical protein